MQASEASSHLKAAAQVNRGSVWGSTGGAAGGADIDGDGESAADAEERLKRPVQARLNSVIARVAAAPCAQALRDANRLIRALRKPLDTIGIDGAPMATEAALAAAVELLPEMDAVRDVTARIATLAADRPREERLLWWAQAATVAPDGDATLSQLVAGLRAAERADFADGAHFVQYVLQDKEFQLYVRNTERALALVERFERLQAKQVRIAAYVSTELRRRHVELAVRESRMAARMPAN